MDCQLFKLHSAQCHKHAVTLFAFIVQTWLVVCVHVVAEAAAGAPSASVLSPNFRAPAVPLIVFSPEHSIWSVEDFLTKNSTRFWWTSQEVALVAAVRVDGISYRLMGDSGNGDGAISTDFVAQQLSVHVLPTTTKYKFLLEPLNINVDLEFFTPMFPNDLTSLALSMSYITFTVDMSMAMAKPRISTAAIIEHDIAVYFDVTAAHVVNSDDEFIVWNDQSTDKQVLLSAGSADQAYFSVVGDKVRMSWGHLYVAALSGSHHLSHSISSANQSRAAFLRSNPLPPLDDRQPRAANDDFPVLAVLIDFGRLASGSGSGSTSHTVLYAYDDVQSILFFGHTYAPYWRHIFDDDVYSFLTFALSGYPQLRARADLYDEELLQDLYAAGGSSYATVAALVFRQTLGSLKIVYDPSLPTEQQVPIVFLKEISSGGAVSTVDVLYPASPFFLLLAPEVLRLALLPVLQYANNETNISYNLPWAPHHLGTWPVCDITPDQQEQMPMEESANMLLMLAALAQRQAHNVSYLLPYKYLLSMWADYLLDTLPDPQDQLCTDDFEGPSPHNANLAAKGVLGVAAYSLLLRDFGEQKLAEQYLRAAQRFAVMWMDLAADYLVPGAELHYKLQYNLPFTWSIKYNLLYQLLLGIDIFPATVFTNESTFYMKHLNKYGVPLDNRAEFVKTDWFSWWAAVVAHTQPDNEFANTILDAIFLAVNATLPRVPICDLYDTNTAARVKFQARPVMGGVYAHMLLKSTVSRITPTLNTNTFSATSPPLLVD